MIKIITCNIRFSSMGGDTNEKSWEHRKELCFSTIMQTQPDVICCQECHNIQFNYIKSLLGSGWNAFWMMTYPNGEYPENAIFIRRDSVAIVSYGGYYLSQKPHVPGTKSWGSECVRFANYLVLETSNGICRVINTHIDHASQEARMKQSQMLIEEAAAWPSDLPQILAGDMNCDIQNPAMQKFILSGWRDSFFEVNKIREPGFTYHGFAGEKWSGDLGVCGNGKIDWILLRGPVTCRDARIIRDHCDETFPSDHYFVTADIVF